MTERSGRYRHAPMQPSDPSPDRRWWALAVLVLPVLIISMDATVLGFAVPHVSESLEPSSSQLLWIIDVYSFVLAGLLVTMGVLGDRVGRRRLLVLGSAGFTVASLIAAFSTSAEMLIVSRALLGVAGATLMPSTLSLLRNIFPDHRERQTAIALWSATFALGSALGPIIGGFLLEHYWWGSVFLVGAPVTGLLLVLGPRLVPESKDPNPGSFDLVGSLLSMLTMIPAVYAVKTVAEDGLGTGSMVAAGIGIVAGVLFVRRQRRVENPMIDVTLFRLPRFRMAVTGNLVACFGFAGSMFFITQHLQLVIGLSPLTAGLRLLPAVLGSTVFLALAPTAARRFGPFPVITTGLTVGALGFLLLTRIGTDSSTGPVVLALLLVYAGLGIAMTVAVDGILTAIPAERAGSGASVSETANELGIALGTAVLGSVLAAVYRPGVDAIAVVPEALDHARETLGAALLTAEQLPEPMADLLITGSRTAFVDGVHTASMVATVLLLATAGWALWTSLRPAGQDEV